MKIPIYKENINFFCVKPIEYTKPEVHEKATYTTCRTTEDPEELQNRL